MLAATAPIDISKYKGRVMTDQEAKELKKARSEYHRLLRRLCNPTMYSIFCSLADRAENDPDGICWPSYETIMEDTNSYNRNIIKQSIAALVELGVLEVGKRGRSNTYKPAKVDSPNSIILIRLSEIKQSQDDTGNRINMIRKSVSKRYSNDSQRTTPKERITLAKASGAEAPPKPDISQPVKPEKADKQEIKPIYQRYREKYETAKDDFKARSGVIGEAWQEITGKPPDFSFLNGLAKEFNSGWKVIDAVLKMASCDVADDPKAYLRKVLSNGTTKPTNGKTNGFSRPAASAGAINFNDDKYKPGGKYYHLTKPPGTG